jgi:transposase
MIFPPKTPPVDVFCESARSNPFTSAASPPGGDSNAQADEAGVARFMVDVFAAAPAMELITILNRCHRSRGFVSQRARFSPDHKSIEVSVRPRKGSAAICSQCHQPGPGYDRLDERRFEFIPLWGFFVFLLYTMRRVDCRRCGIVVVEEVPWGHGKRTLTKAYMLFLARWARRLSWKETAQAFRTSWEKVFDAVEHAVTWGLEHRTLGQIDAIGVDEIQYAKGHKYLTLVYQIDLDVTRLLWVGRERTIESFRGFFTVIGDELASKIVFVCSDMWEPYLKVIREKCSEALHIPDRFHIVAKMNKAPDEVRAIHRLKLVVADICGVGLYFLLKQTQGHLRHYVEDPHGAHSSEPGGETGFG